MGKNQSEIERRLNLDFIMSACALMLSAVVCATALYQLRNASRQMSAQTWPYVTIGWHYDNDESGILVTNDGQGPAIIYGVALRLDGQPQHDVISALRRIVSGPAAVIHIDALVHGTVLRPGQELHLLSVRGAAWDKQLRDAKGRIAVELCYCSVLDRCWTNILNEMPQETAQCGESSNLVMPEPN
jgi:hypothetical protein